MRRGEKALRGWSLLSALLLGVPHLQADDTRPTARAVSAAAPSMAVIEFYTRPLVKARLRVPNSLRDYAVAAVTPSVDDPSRFEVEVHFQAKTPFGSYTTHSAAFQMKRATSEGSWIVTAK